MWSDPDGGPGEGQGGDCCGPCIKAVALFFAQASGGRGGARGPGGLLTRQGESQHFPSRDRHTPSHHTPALRQSHVAAHCSFQLPLSLPFILAHRVLPSPGIPVFWGPVVIPSQICPNWQMVCSF